MKRTLILSLMAGAAMLMLSACAQDNYYNSNYNSYDNSMDRVAQNAVNDAVSNLSSQDIKNLNNLK